MRRRLLSSTALIALAAVLLLGVPLGLVGARLVRGATTDRLERDADAVASRLDERIERRKPVTPALLGRLAPSGREVEVRLPDGHLVRGGTRIEGEALQARAGGREALVTVRAPESEVDSRTTAVWLAVLVLSVIASLVAAALALVQSRRLARPLERLAGRSARLGTPAFALASQPSGVPEVDELAAVVERAAERIDRLLAREREFSANASHQLRTPLTALRMHLEELERLDRDGAAGREEARAALAQADRLQSVIADLERLARGRAGGGVEEVDAAALAREQVAAWAPRYRAAGRPLVVELAEPLRAVASPGVIRQALDVLLDNALRHGRGTVTVRSSRADQAVGVVVADEGPGVPPQRVGQVFERGVSLGGGSGLGLAVARELVESIGGELRLAERRSAFELTLPAAPARQPVS